MGIWIIVPAILINYDQTSRVVAAFRLRTSRGPTGPRFPERCPSQKIVPQAGQQRLDLRSSGGYAFGDWIPTWLPARAGNRRHPKSSDARPDARCEEGIRVLPRRRRKDALAAY